MFIRSAYNYDVDLASLEAGLEVPEGDDFTQQQFKEEVDINTIIKRFGLTGELPENLAMPQSGDFTGISDFHTAMNLVRASQEEFMRVPAEIRARFNNDPGRFIEFVEDDKNYDEAIKLGLAVKKPPPERTVVAAVDELAAKFKGEDPKK